MKSLLLRFPIRLAGCVALGALPAVGLAQPAAPSPQKMAPAAARPASAELTPQEIAAREKRLEWFHEAKFGLFIHWGLYSIPAGYWKGERSPGIGEWIMNRMKIPVGEYEKLASGFNPYKFDAEAWAQLAQDAGMKYVVITSKHHDGFAMYHSTVSKYNVYDATPWRRDPLKELADACAKRGLKFGFYYSQSQDWHEPGGAGNTWDFGPDEAKYTNGSYDKYLQEKAEPQVKELLQNYGPVCLIWFDTAREMNGERGLVIGFEVGGIAAADAVRPVGVGQQCAADADHVDLAARDHVDDAGEIVAAVEADAVLDVIADQSHRKIIPARPETENTPLALRCAIG